MKSWNIASKREFWDYIITNFHRRINIFVNSFIGSFIHLLIYLTNIYLIFTVIYVWGYPCFYRTHSN